MTRTVTVTVIADDLSGAADAGAAFAAAGLATFVTFDATRQAPPVEVLAIDIDSRSAAAAEAARRAGDAARQALAAGTRVIYKKIDSTLRGNVGVELAATLAAAGAAFAGQAPVVLVSPAFPKAARIVRNGQVLVRGVPLVETEVWRQGGRGPCDLAAILRNAGLTVASSVSAALRADRTHIERLAAGGAQAIVCDAEDDVDLRALAEAGARLERPVIWAGSAGLARHLPAALGLEGRRHPPAAAPGGAGPTLVLVGSRSEVSREQARRVAAETSVESFAVPAGVLAAGEGSTAWGHSAARLARTLMGGHDVVLTVADQDAQAPAASVAAGLGRLCAALQHLGGLVATGADTARAALVALGGSGLHLTGEVEPGVPIGTTDAPRPMRVITKAGAFGTPHTLVRCRAALRSGRE